MTALRRAHHAHSSRTRKPLSALVSLSMHTAQSFGIDSVGSTAGQLRAMERFVASLRD